MHRATHCGSLIVACLFIAHLGGRVNATLFTNDGILIEEVGPTRTIRAVWTTLVVINPPKQVPMRAWVSRVRRGIRSVGSKVSQQDQQTWRARLDALDLQQPVVGSNHSRSFRSLHRRRKRTRRGLLNLVGTVSKSLFGTATESDVNELRAALDDVGRTTDMLVHDHRRMISVVNQTRKYVQENRMDIRDLQRHQEALDGQILNFVDNVTRLAHTVSKLTLARSIDQVIEELYVAHESYSAQMGAFLTQRYELERGWLTENTLSMQELNDILLTIRKAGYETLNAVWYYENLRIEPLWTEGGKLVFRVILPAVGQTQYLQYKIHFYPVALDSEHVRIVRGHNDVTINTETGAVFWPIKCYESNPRVCAPQKETLTPTCEWGLVTNNSLDHCTIEISKRTSKDSDIFPRDIGDFVIVAYKKMKVTLRCLGRAALVKDISGPIQMKIPGDCKLETAQWQVYGTRKGSSIQVRKRVTMVYNKTMDFVLSPDMKTEVHQALKFRSRVQVQLLDVKGWQQKYKGFGLHDQYSSGEIAGGSLALVVIIVLVVAVIIARRKCKGKLNPSVRTKVPCQDRVDDKTEGLSDLELASLAV